MQGPLSFVRTLRLFSLQAAGQVGTIYHINEASMVEVPDQRCEAG